MSSTPKTDKLRQKHIDEVYDAHTAWLEALQHGRELEQQLKHSNEELARTRRLLNAGMRLDQDGTL